MVMGRTAALTPRTSRPVASRLPGCSGYVEPGRYDEVIFRGDVGQRQFIAFWLGNGGRAR
jgi:hypothetical protein